MAPGIAPGAITFAQFRACFLPSIRPGFPQHDAQEQAETEPNGRKSIPRFRYPSECR